ncbi:MAG: tetracycline resistance MFS efflux pump [Ignavibacteria bacterium]|nr:MAG: tetracycline resistance MFS efflux pump [Ignavibacteria bacterium]
MKKKSALSLIFLTVFIDLLGFGILIPILPTFAKIELLVDETAIGVVVAVYSFVQFLFNPVLGRLSDKFGRKPIIVISLFINAIGYILFAFTTSYILLLVSRIVAGIGGSSISVAQAYIADITTKENRAKGMGVIGAAFGLGFVFGPLMGGFLASYGYMVTGFASATFSILAFIFTIAILPESNLNRNAPAETKRKLIDVDDLKNVFAKPERAMLIFLFFVLTFSFANIYGTFALLGLQVYGFSDMQNGFMFGIIGLTSAIVQGGLIGRISKVISKKNILKIGSFFIMVSLALIPYGATFLGLAIISIFLSIGTGMFQPTVLSLISEVTPENEQGVTLGVNQSVSAFARVLGPLWGGFAFEFLGYPYPFLTGAAFTLIIFIATVYYIPKKLSV